MKKKTIFRGAASALITPLNEQGVDYAALERLLEWQIAEGIDGLVICGTTGEGATLSDREHREVLRFSVEAVRGRVPMIAGTGSNDTSYACELTRFACALGYDAGLAVTPYYNKATQKGLVAMYKTIAASCDLPLLIYNVPSRTGVNVEPETYAALAEVPNIAGIKEANGNVSKIVETAALVGDALDIYSGNDDEIVPILACGGKGVISVLSNPAPRQTAELCRKYFDGDVAGAMEDQKKYLPLIRSLFCEVNPIPVKAAMAKLGWCDDYLRLPLTPMEDAHRQVMFRRMRDVGLLDGEA